MLDRLETSFETQNNFISNASHELSTPLTAIIGEAEVTLSKDRTYKEYTEALHIVLNEAERLDKITKSLLFLAQTGFDGKKQKMELLRADELLWDTKKTIDKMNPANQFDALAQASQNRSLTPEQMQEIPGDWSDSCRNALVNGNSLVAECTDKNGNWVSSAVDAQSCMTAIDNQDGRMICAAPGEADALAQGTRGRRMTPQQMRQIPGECGIPAETRL